MDKKTGWLINSYDFCQPITDVYCGQLTNESAYERPHLQNFLKSVKSKPLIPKRSKKSRHSARDSFVTFISLKQFYYP